MNIRFRTSLLLGALFLLLLSSVSPVGAEEHGTCQKDERPEMSAELRKVLNGLDRANEDLEGVRAKVVYKRQIPLLDESETADGQLAFKKPDYLHLRLGDPRNEEIYSDGKQWWVISHEDKQVEVYPAADREGSIAEASFLTFGYGQSSDSLLEDYDISLEDTETRKDNGQDLTSWHLRFQPRDKEQASRFSVIEVTITNEIWLPQKLILHESDGEIVHSFDLRKITVNPGLKEKDFRYSAPRGYTILKPE